MTTPLTAHFSLEELTHSDTAVAHGVANTPDQEARRALVVLARGLEEVRTCLDAYPVKINDGWVGHSAHQSGYAADFTCKVFGSPYDVACAIAKSGIAFDQLIQEGTWVHISFDPAMRHQRLTKRGSGYVAGIQRS